MTGPLNIYVVIVTYNGMKWIDKCLHHVLLSDIPVKVMLIDNCSTDGTAAFVKKKYPQIDIIETGENLGFGGANNICIKKALREDADFVFLLNQDGYLEKDALRKLVEFQMSHPEYGVLSPQQKNGNGSGLDEKFRTIVLGQCVTNSFEDLGRTIYDVTFVMGAFWLISAACLKKVGLFDSIFYHYGEDSDYLSRVRFHGFKIGIVMDSVGYHDRQERVVPEMQQLKSFYASQMASLTNINRSMAFCLGKVSYFYLKFSIGYLSKLKFNLLKENTRHYFSLLSKTGQILKSRNQNKQSEAWHFMDA
ncbi:glycosyltransferase family 2 protein [Mucilaginibacter sp. BT774]|uniref:glycosyltransferase family 2 protein n=1 Tax=Mucilaginibacter sp. BT774 TaxID=3062276 RepID=UPI00267568B8|nr:glycosyltransferase family 2 protein [Mucilaginibacter sp. BT774]MDO3626809.1 glycosyltransferase family 2 protein [Mucilaginibacter sp. BT774]